MSGEYLRQGLPIASGVIEASCKTLVTQRMKQSGMAWTQAGGQAILTLRSLIQSDRWLPAWELLRSTFRKPVTVCHAQTTLPATSRKENFIDSIRSLTTLIPLPYPWLDKRTFVLTIWEMHPCDIVKLLRPA